MIILDHPIDPFFGHGSLGIKAGLAAKVFNAIQSLGFKAGDPENHGGNAYYFHLWCVHTHKILYTYIYLYIYTIM